MGSHMLHKKRRHSHQQEATHQHADKRRKRHRSIIKGNHSPRNHKGREFIDSQDSFFIEQSADDYIHTWLEQVTKEHQGHMHQPTSGFHNDPFIHVPPVDGHGRHSSEQFSRAVVKDVRPHKRRRYDSSDSSMLLPLYERSELSHQDRLSMVAHDVSKEHAKHLSNEHGKKRKKREISSSRSDESQSESDQSQLKETFEKRSRHKTRADRYESKPAIKKVDKNSNSVKKKTIKVKRGDAAKLSRKAGEDLIKGFRSKNVSQDRLTMRPGAGIYNNGRASSPSRQRGLPDLAFSEMQFLKRSNRPPAGSEKEVIISKSSLKSKRERERVRNEISNYFLPERQPLQETTINHERMGNSEFPSDAGKSEATSIVMRRYSRPVKSTRKQTTEGELYSDFGNEMPSIRKSTLPKQNQAEIFTPRAPVESHNNTLSKTTSYYTWSETVKTPSVHGRSRATDAPQNQERGVSRASGKRTPVQSRIYKEIGIQASLNPATDLSTKSTVVKQDSRKGDIQQAADQPFERAGNLSTAGIVASQIGIKDHGEDEIYQLQANRAVLHDCTPHRHSTKTSENCSVKSPGPCRTEVPMGSIQDNTHIEHATAIQCPQVDTDKINQQKNDSNSARQLYQDPEAQNILSRAILAQRAYINRHSTLKTTVDLAASTSDAQAPVVYAPNARDATCDIPDGSYELLGSNTSTTPQDQYGNVQDRASQSPQVPIVLDGLNEDTSLSVRDNLLQGELGHISTSIGQGQSKNNHDVGHVDGSIYRVNDLSHGVNNAAFAPGRVENKDNLPQAMLPGRGFASIMTSMYTPQSRNISQLSTMEPIYTQQLRRKVPITEEELHEVYDTEEQELGNIYLYDGGLWEKESRTGLSRLQQSPFVEAGNVCMGQDSQCDMYEKHHDDFRLADDAMYYEEEVPLLAEDYHRLDVTSRPEGMLFFEQESGASKEYQWMPTQRRYFSSATDNLANLGSWESAQTGLVSQGHLLEFWRPRKGY